jgi:hypothetical protein
MDTIPKAETNGNGNGLADQRGPPSGIANDGSDLADCLRETQWVVENLARDLREHADFFGQYKRYREWADFMNTDADLLDQAWRRLKWQIRLNHTLMSRSSGAQS